MSCLTEVGGGMPTWRRIAAAYVTASLADSQLNPFLPCLYAFFAAVTARCRSVRQKIAMRAFISHAGSLTRNSGQPQAFCEMAAIAGILERHPGDQLVDSGARLKRQAPRHHLPRAFRMPEVRVARRQHGERPERVVRHSPL